MTEDKRNILRLAKEGAEFGYNLAKEEMDYLNKHWKSEEELKGKLENE